MFDRGNQRLEVQISFVSDQQVKSLGGIQALDLWPEIKQFIWEQDGHMEMEGMAPRGDLELQ
eukprot:2631511-Lingulodinium_polyedra.AAC.1